MTLRVYNSLHRQKEVFAPLHAGKVGMYVCGVTVYDYCHIGHARVMVVFDTIYRWLQASGYDVDYVRNFTDVDDKIIRRASESGVSIRELTDAMIAAFYEDMDALGCLRPTHEPRATMHMDEIQAMIASLLDAGAAYLGSSGDVLYAVRDFADYGQLSGKNIDELESGSRVDVDQRKRDPLDFALWKLASDDEPGWDSPWGYGRPGWHIECSAMSCKHLGASFDIHGGGMDLKFPHHENEIAQACAANGGDFARYWLHNGFVNINAEKMSKSLGNFFTIREVLQKYDAETLRMFILATHYRSPLDFSDAALDVAKASLDRIYTTRQRIEQQAQPWTAALEHLPGDFVDAMNDDFNTAEALAIIFEHCRSINKALDHDEDCTNSVQQFSAMCGLFGLAQRHSAAWFQQGADDDSAAIEARIAQRNQARKDRDFALADQIRDALLSEGVVLEDSAQGTTWKRQ